ncbi:DEBR0S5_07404g1_1 [Brettanomyces bruxellensis]|uniref:DEBR0S5_07404g1_1 n=2 Tax=Dekkera bruxellensis TaxID=5007 RepID=A0A7D9CZL3_DEKBR|nr:DEBR0S5_07404g1_1 [Brettanomyces bruxellensis]
MAKGDTKQKSSTLDFQDEGQGSRLGSVSPSSRSNSRLSTPSPEIQGVASGESSKKSLGSPIFPPSANNRFSMSSSYSGVVQNADIDTIRYVVNDNSSRQYTNGRRSMNRSSEVRTVGSDLAHRESYRSSASTARTLATSTSQNPESSSIREAVILPTTTGEPILKGKGSPGSAPDKENSVDLEHSVPARSSRRPISTCIGDMESITEGVSTCDSHSISASRRTSLIGPRILPDKEISSSSKDNASMRHARRLSRKLSGKFGELMQQVESLKSELDANPQIPSSEHSPVKKDDTHQSGEDSDSSSDGITSKRNSTSSANIPITPTSTASFHTAVSNENDWEDEEEDDDDTDAASSVYSSTFTRNATLSERTKSVRTLQTGKSRGMVLPVVSASIGTSGRNSTYTSSAPSKVSTKPEPMQTNSDLANKEAAVITSSESEESSSSIQPSLQDSGSTKALDVPSTISHPDEAKSSESVSVSVGKSTSRQGLTKTRPASTYSSVRKSVKRNSLARSSKSSAGKHSRHQSKGVSSFSYDTLARLLNATDGIVIGQEFSSLDMPVEEKYLLEKIVGSISRLTANMMLDPQRYDKSYARLEKALNILEGFD